MSRTQQSQGQPGAINLPLCAGSGEGSDPLGLLYGVIQNLSKGHFGLISSRMHVEG